VKRISSRWRPFVVAFASVAYQVAEYFRGARVQIFPPEQILIHGEKNADGQTYVRYAARMSYINSGDIGYNAVVDRESPQVQIGGRTYRQIWQSFVHSGSPIVRSARSETSRKPNPFRLMAETR